MLRILITGRNHTVPHYAFTSSGMTPAARATGDLSRPATIEARTVQRSVSASQCPVPNPLTAARGDWVKTAMDVLTVISGLAVFGMIGFFFLLLS